MRSDRRRDKRRIDKGQGEEGFSLKNTLYVAGTILALAIIAFVITVMVYNNSLEKIYDDLEARELGDLAVTNNEEKETEEASANLRKNN